MKGLAERSGSVLCSAVLGRSLECAKVKRGGGIGGTERKEAEVPEEPGRWGMKRSGGSCLGRGTCGPTGGGLMGEEPDTPDSSLPGWRPSHLLMTNGR